MHAEGSRLSVDERRELGRLARKSVPRSSHAEWAPAPDREDAVDVLAAQDADRVSMLVPIRHRRMAASAFAFYRGTAAIMAADLAATPASGFGAQICGDAHLSNFGAFASPERDLVFDLNDFDETLPGPWEWDVKRLAASLVLAGRHLGVSRGGGEHVAAAAVERYRDAMRELASRPSLEAWYERVRIEDVRRLVERKARRKRLERNIARARRRTHIRSFAKLAEVVDGRARIRSDPPLLVPFRELPPELAPPEWEARVHDSFSAYRETLPDELQVLLGRYRLTDVALKVVGVGSVGTRCFVGLLIGRDERDPLFLQVKEAGPSVLEPVLGPSRYANCGRRVVEGQRLMQAFGDVFLGWSGVEETGRDFYWRQLKDMKGSAEIDAMDTRALRRYGELCGWTLARAHARSADAVAVSAYLGKGKGFPRAVARFAEVYADQAIADHAAFVAAVESSRLESVPPEGSPVAA